MQQQCWEKSYSELAKGSHHMSLLDMSMSNDPSAIDISNPFHYYVASIPAAPLLASVIRRVFSFWGCHEIRQTTSYLRATSRPSHCLAVIEKTQVECSA